MYLYVVISDAADTHCSIAKCWEPVCLSACGVEGADGALALVRWLEFYL